MEKSEKYDLEKRTRNFAKDVIILLRTLRQDAINQRLISQLVASSGSIGANYCEAVEAESKKDFVHKVSIAKKEIKESKHWLELIKTAHPEIEKDVNILFKECHELLLIFSKIIYSSKLSI